MSYESIQQRIDGFIAKDPKRVVDMWSPKKNDLIHDSMLASLGMPRDRSISLLDIGCGNGTLLNSLARNGYDLGKIRYTGIDVSAKAIEYCKQTWPTKDFEQTAQPHGHFDYCFCAGPWAYKITDDKVADIRYGIGEAMCYCTHGIGYFLYTERRYSKPGQVFIRFTPHEIAECLVGLPCEGQVTIRVDPGMIAEYVQDVAYCDLDKGFVIW